MKRIVSAVLVTILVLSFSIAGKSAALNANNFRISSYNVSYELSRTSDNRSQLKTVEQITAEFPSYDQNHGLERAIPTSYDTHPVDLHIDSITDATGKQIPYSIDQSSDVYLVRIGEADTYVHGSQTYKITYTQKDVTKFFSDTARDEWYWDTNGTQWRVPIDALNVSVKIDSGIATALAGDPQCYVGTAGSTTKCAMTNIGGAYTTSAQNLQPGENITVAFGFTQGTFATYKMSLWDSLFVIWVFLQVLTVILAVIFVIILIVATMHRYYRSAETKIVVPEYIPPRDASVTISAQAVPAISRSVFSAQLIDLAVRHYIVIIETKEKVGWRPAEYEIKVITDVTPLRDEEKEILTDMFNHVPAVGETIALSSLQRNIAYVSRTADNARKTRDLVNTTYVLREKSPIISKYFYRWATVLIIFAVLTLSPPLAFVALAAFIIGKVIRPLNDKGIELRRYVLGLDKYIKASETERLTFLQGPDTAEKVGYSVNPNDPGQLIKLYERTLPYAVLLGREKQWASRLGEFYQTTQTSPDWYVGRNGFNAAVFGASVSSFSQASAAASGYSAGSSSSSGGSGGGGFSGGGGGGGGGGGW